MRFSLIIVCFLIQTYAKTTYIRPRDIDNKRQDNKNQTTYVRPLDIDNETQDDKNETTYIRTTYTYSPPPNNQTKDDKNEITFVTYSPLPKDKQSFLEKKNHCLKDDDKLKIISNSNSNRNNHLIGVSLTLSLRYTFYITSAKNNLIQGLTLSVGLFPSIHYMIGKIKKNTIQAFIIGSGIGGLFSWKISNKSRFGIQFGLDFLQFYLMNKYTLSMNKDIIKNPAIDNKRSMQAFNFIKEYDTSPTIQPSPYISLFFEWNILD